MKLVCCLYALADRGREAGKYSEGFEGKQCLCVSEQLVRYGEAIKKHLYMAVVLKSLYTKLVRVPL